MGTVSKAGCLKGRDFLCCNGTLLLTSVESSVLKHALRLRKFQPLYPTNTWPLYHGPSIFSIFQKWYRWYSSKVMVTYFKRSSSSNNIFPSPFCSGNRKSTLKKSCSLFILSCSVNCGRSCLWHHQSKSIKT